MVPVKVWVTVGMVSLLAAGLGAWLHEHDQYVKAKALAEQGEVALDSALEAQERVREAVERRSAARADSIRVLRTEREAARREAEAASRRYGEELDELLADAPAALEPRILRLDSIHGEEVGALRAEIAVLESKNALLRSEVSDLEVALESTEDALHRALEQKDYWRETARRGMRGPLGTVVKVGGGLAGGYVACRAGLVPGCSGGGGP